MFKDFNTMITAQEELNNKYVPNWRESVVMEQQLTAAFTELAEWFESAPRAGGVVTNGVSGWKWWKRNLECDTQNKRIEVIDVWHFMMSTWLMLGDKETIEKYVNEFSPEDLSSSSNLMNILKMKCGYIVFSIDGDLKDSIRCGLNLLHFMMIETEGMGFEDLENGYFLKNKLNHARVEGGYQDGSYSKHDEDGQEDNRKLEV